MTMQVVICGKEQKRAKRGAAVDSSHRLDDVDQHQLELDSCRERGSATQIWQCAIGFEDAVDFGSDLELLEIGRAGEACFSCCV